MLDIDDHLARARRALDDLPRAPFDAEVLRDRACRAERRRRWIGATTLGSALVVLALVGITSVNSMRGHPTAFEAIGQVDDRTSSLTATPPEISPASQVVALTLTAPKDERRYYYPMVDLAEVQGLEPRRLGRLYFDENVGLSEPVVIDPSDLIGYRAPPSSIAPGRSVTHSVALPALAPGNYELTVHLYAFDHVEDELGTYRDVGTASATVVVSDSSD